MSPPVHLVLIILSFSITVQTSIIFYAVPSSKTSIQSQDDPVTEIIHDEVDRAKCFEACPLKAEHVCNNSSLTLRRCSSSRPIEWTVTKFQEGFYSVFGKVEDKDDSENSLERKRLYRLDLCIYSNVTWEEDKTNYNCKTELIAVASDAIEINGIVEVNWTTASCHSNVAGPAYEDLMGPFFLSCRNIIECGNRLNFLQAGGPFLGDADASIGEYRNLQELYRKSRNPDYGYGVAICRTRDHKHYRSWGVFLSLQEGDVTFPVTYGFPRDPKQDIQDYAMRLMLHENDTVKIADEKKIKVGESLRFKCLVSGYFFMQGVRWRLSLDGKSVNLKDYDKEVTELVYGRNNYVSSTLKITITKDMMFMDTLEATCVASQWKTDKTNETSLELSKPVIDYFPETMTVSTETVAEVGCTARGNPCPALEFYLNGNVVTPSAFSNYTDAGCAKTDKGKSITRSKSFVINGTRDGAHKLVGNFTCKATNAFGSTMRRFDSKLKPEKLKSDSLLKWLLPTTGVFMTIIACLVGVIWHYYTKERLSAKLVNSIFLGQERRPYFEARFEVPYLSWTIDKAFEVLASESRIDSSVELGRGSMAVVRPAQILLNKIVQDHPKGQAKSGSDRDRNDKEHNALVTENMVPVNTVWESVVAKLPLHYAREVRLEFIYEIKHWTKVMNSLHPYRKYIAKFRGYYVTENADKIAIFIERYDQDLETYFLGSRNQPSKSIYPVDDIPKAAAGYKQWAPAASNQIYLTHLLRLAYQISKGLECLASSSVKIVHGDLAPRNILLTNTVKPDARITDFGLSKSYGIAINNMDRSQIFVRPPESFDENSPPPSEKWDVWGYGILLWEMFSFCQKSPYQDEGLLVDGNIDQSLQNITNFLKSESTNRLQKPDFCPREIYEIMLDCWNLNHEQRPKFTEITEQLKLYAQSCGVLESIRDSYDS